MRRVGAIVLALLLSPLALSCVQGARAPLTTPGGSASSGSEAALRAQVARFADAVNRKDLRALQEIPASVFSLNTDVALRFYTHTTMSDNPNPSGKLSDFFADFFAENENIELSLTVDTVTINGNEAEVIVQFALSALYLLEVPPITYQAESTDLMVFSIVEEQWRLVSWQEQPPEVPDETVLLGQVDAIAGALNDEDLDALVAAFSPLLMVDSDFALRFMTPATQSEPPTPSTDPAVFFAEFLNGNRNVNASLGVNTYFIIGDEATVEVTFTLYALYVGELPAASYQVGPAVDIMQFELWEGQWLLKSWVEKPAPPEPTPDEAALVTQVDALADAVNDENAGGFQALLSPLFAFNEEVQLRFRTQSTLADPPAPPEDTGAFLAEVFGENENLALSLVVDEESICINGSVATLRARCSLSATYMKRVPPEDYEAAAVVDIMVFEYASGVWKLVAWRPVS